MIQKKMLRSMDQPGVFVGSAVEWKAQVDAKMKKVVWSSSCELYHWSLMILYKSDKYYSHSWSQMRECIKTYEFSYCGIFKGWFFTSINIINPSYFWEFTRHVPQRVESCSCRALTAWKTPRRARSAASCAAGVGDFLQLPPTIQWLLWYLLLFATPPNFGGRCGRCGIEKSQSIQLLSISYPLHVEKLQPSSCTRIESARKRCNPWRNSWRSLLWPFE